MIRKLLMLAVFVVSTSHAASKCPEVKVDYEADCAFVPNLENLQTLDKAGDCATIRVKARSHWNASWLRLEGGERYQIDVTGKWCDASVVTDNRGWDVDSGGKTPAPALCPESCGKCVQACAVEGGDINLEFTKNAFIQATTFLRRHCDANLFALFGFVEGEMDTQEYELNKPRNMITPEVDGNFCAYANDVTFAYGNNSGSLLLTITRMSD